MIDGDETPQLEAVVEFEYPGVGRIELHGETEDEYVFGLIKQDRQFYESDVLRLLEHLDLPVGLAVDAGAHIGNHSVFFAKVLGLKTVSVEPRPESFALLQRNILANGVESLVTAVQAVLGAGPGRVNLEQQIDGNTGSVTTRYESLGEYEVRRLDDIVDGEVVLLKVDVEGDERVVLDGAEEMLFKSRPLVVVEAHTGRALTELVEILSPLEYEPIAIAGRSDNFVFASRAPSAPIAFETAQRRSELFMERRRDQILGTAMRGVAAQVRGVDGKLGGSNELMTRLLTVEQKMSRLDRGVQELTEVVSTQMATTIQSLQTELEDRDRRVAAWQREYSRVTRSRALRTANRLRGLAAKIGLPGRAPIASPEEIEAMLDQDD